MMKLLPALLLAPILCAYAEIDFNRDVRPILSDKCFKCHGPDARNQKSDFRLDSFEQATKDHQGMVGLSPGSLEDSEIHWRIRTNEADEVMPPPESKLPLTEREKDLLDQWIKEGGKYDSHWAFRLLPESVEVPPSKHPSPGNEIDHFIARALDGSPLEPSPEADKVSWLRRATFDLTGLPPSIEQVDAFIADSSEDAYGKVVDRLMDSDEYAERMTSEWLDVARYSDTYGYQVDRNRNVWPWRDWVIRSFRKNQPYDRFVTEQVAGDLIPNATRDQILATCFNRLHPQKVEGGSVPEEFRIEYVTDRVHTFGTAFLGLTMECTRCHDHKYDPVTQKDYFSLSAFFNNIDEAGLYSYFTGSVPTPTLELGDLPSDEKVRHAEEKLAEIAVAIETDEAFQEWTRSIEEEKIGSAVFFSEQALPPENPSKNRNPGEFKPSLWLDASELDSSGGTWNDRSERENHAKRHGSPMVIAHKASGLKVMKFDSQKNDYHEWKEITGIRSVFWVMSKKAGNHGSPLSHPSVHHFYSNGSKFWHPQHTHENVRKGKLRVNGAPGDASSPYPNQLAVVSLVTPGKVTASRIGKDRGFGGKYNWDGEIGELLIYERELSGEEVEQVENFLIGKWKIESKPQTEWGAPLAYLSFDQREGNRYPNEANPAKAANTNGNNKEVEGKLGKGIQFTGDDALNFPSGFGDFNRHQSFSMAFWVKPTQLLDRAVIARRSKAWTDAASRGYEVLIEDGRLSPALIHFWPGNAIRIRSKKRLAVNEWTHVGLTYDGSSRARGLKLYENGKAADVDVVKDHLTREITGGGDPFLGFAQRMRDRGFKNGMLDEFYLFDRVLTASEVSRLSGLAKGSEEEARRAVFLQSVYPPAVTAQREIYNERKSFGDQRQRLTEIMVMKEMPGLRETHVLGRGLYSERGEVVERATPQVLPRLPKGAPKNRLGLAEWLTSPDHPLLARVTVNRYWQMIFGRGLVSTSEDFGMQGKPPTHPQLLDWLARDFVNSGWDLRRLLKTMVLSHTYRQESRILANAKEQDPENLLLSRAPAYRLNAEMIRDGLLAQSGLLHKKVGGGGSRPYDLKVSFKPINPDGAPNVYRRSLYTFWKRTGPAPVMMALDASKRDVCTVRRERTDSASQALILLNGTQFVEAARATADRLIENHGEENPEKLAREAFRQLTSRYPDERESGILLRLLREQREFFKDEKETKKFLEVGYYRAKTKNSALLAAVTNFVSTLMNFDETLSKR
tara:strand:+ start:551 stop:4282 length:3732 start_codon:yes stop_codon:yes gene_type:complete